MIDIIRVLASVRQLFGYDADEAFDISPTVSLTCREISDRLLSPDSASDGRIFNACVYLSFYRILLRGVLTGEITDTVKAGDITVSQSPTLRLEWAARMRDEAMLAAYPLLDDTDFVFRQV